MASIIIPAAVGYTGMVDGVWTHFDPNLPPHLVEGAEAWMFDPKIKPPPLGGWPHRDTLGMDVAGLARRAGVSVGVANTVVQRHLQAMNTLAAGPNEPDEYDNPDIYPQNLPGAIGRRSYGEWNKYTGEVWSSPRARNTWRYHSEGYVNRAVPSGMANKRPEDMYRYVTEEEKRVYWMLYYNKTGPGPEPYWSGSVSVEPPYPDSPHVLGPNGKWGPPAYFEAEKNRQLQLEREAEDRRLAKIREEEARIAKEAEQEEEGGAWLTLKVEPTVMPQPPSITPPVQPVMQVALPDREPVVKPVEELSIADFPLLPEPQWLMEEELESEPTGMGNILPIAAAAGLAGLFLLRRGA
jgi:hypothetical protein